MQSVKFIEIFTWKQRRIFSLSKFVFFALKMIGKSMCQYQLSPLLSLINATTMSWNSSRLYVDVSASNRESNSRCQIFRVWPLTFTSIFSCFPTHWEKKNELSMCATKHTTSHCQTTTSIATYRPQHTRHIATRNCLAGKMSNPHLQTKIWNLC